ncbi:YjzD family protein [Fundicoccus sp. Sow4_H7]|uniref:YjzD family protein n=1 Tax=Fundicoccus sp. Sow4_H7 TaxID=3438784 RepID=UPI003F8E66CA
MKYIITIIWGFILGHVVYYLGSSLTSTPYDFTLATILGLVMAVATVVLAQILLKSDNEEVKKS